MSQSHILSEYLLIWFATITERILCLQTFRQEQISCNTMEETHQWNTDLSERSKCGCCGGSCKKIEGNLSDIKIAAYIGVSTLCVLSIDHMIDLKAIVDCIVDHHDMGMSLGDYFLLFIMNCLSEPSSKIGIESWMPQICTHS